MSRPTQEQVKRHFKNAQEIKCLKTGLLIDIGQPSQIDFSDGDYRIAKGNITIWSDGKYAEITKRKTSAKCQCATCNCKEKNKTVKRKLKK